jgi:hypothetical protein
LSQDGLNTIYLNYDNDFKDPTNENDQITKAYRVNKIDDESAQIIENICSNYSFLEEILRKCDLSLRILLSAVEALEKGESSREHLRTLKLMLRYLKINFKSLLEEDEKYTHNVLGHITRKRKRNSNDRI